MRHRLTRTPFSAPLQVCSTKVLDRLAYLTMYELHLSDRVHSLLRSVLTVSPALFDTICDEIRADKVAGAYPQRRPGSPGSTGGSGNLSGLPHGDDDVVSNFSVQLDAAMVA